MCACHAIHGKRENEAIGDKSAIEEHRGHGFTKHIMFRSTACLQPMQL